MKNAEVLSSWKEIAAHLGKGVRTVQRWEAQLGLPVRRPMKARKGVVMAFPRELDEWSKKHQVQRESTPTRERSRQARELATDLLKRSTEIRALAQSLSERCQAILNKTKTRTPFRHIA